MIDDIKKMHLVLDEAERIITCNESPFAAGILIDETFIIAGNQSRTTGNPNMHAEIVCINEVCKKYDVNKLNDAVIYSSCQPCLMCLHSIYNAGIRKLVYSATIDDAILYGSGDISIDIKSYLRKLNMQMDIKGEVLREKAIKIFKKCIETRGEL